MRARPRAHPGRLMRPGGSTVSDRVADEPIAAGPCATTSRSSTTDLRWDANLLLTAPAALSQITTVPHSRTLGAALLCLDGCWRDRRERERAASHELARRRLVECLPCLGGVWSQERL